MIKNIDEIFEQDEEKRKLNINDGKWRMCDLLLLSGGDEYYNAIYIATLDKKYTNDDREALRYLLIKIMYESSEYGEGWHSSSSDEFNTIHLEKYIKYDLRFEEAKPITNEYAYHWYNVLFNGPMEINNYNKAEFFFNDVAINREEVKNNLTPSEMIHSIAFENYWNAIKIFIECKDKWVFIKWSTGA
ncbi:hypothetical protein [Emticicia fontis]